MAIRLYTIGHSNQTAEEFLQLLRIHGINCVVDVRSIPASKYSPQFNEDPLRSYLKSNGIIYLPFGHDFGARRYDCLDENNQVNFELAVKTPAFQHGVKRLLDGLNQRYKISLMCSEANPLECHRFSLVSRYFYTNGLDVQHILKGAELASHQELEREMILEYLKKKKLPEVDLLFGLYTSEQQTNDAYRLKNKEIGFIPQTEIAAI
jgi:uncharacterized protein (DUF488 family)